MGSSAKAKRQRQNELTAGYFALAMLGLVFLFTLIHWIDLILQRRSIQNDGIFVRKVIGTARRTRSVLLRKVPGFPSVGHAIVFLVYIFINITLSFYEIDWSVLNNFAKRLGWIALCNIVLITLLALKNTPLAVLTGYSYERLNVFHQVAGYCTIIWSLCHAVIYLAAWSTSDNLHDMIELSNVMGVVAGISMLIILISALLLRKFRYEVFYVIHIVLFVLILIAVGMHRPDIEKKTVAVVVTATGIWLGDRLFRSGRMAWYAYGNHASIIPLPHGGVRLSLSRAPKFVAPGSHCFLWIPSIRAGETHPFTIVSTNPLELVIAAQDGFTKDLVSRAQRSPGVRMRASIDGPYGALPDFAKFDELVLVAGGSGASFAFGIMIDLVRRFGAEFRKPAVNFIWVMREFEKITWFAPELEMLKANPNISISIFITRSRSISGMPCPPDADLLTKTTLDLEKQVPVNVTTISASPNPSESKDDVELQKSAPLSTTSPTGLKIEYLKPSIPHLIHATLATAAPHSRLMIAACGPASMLRSARETVVDLRNGAVAAATADYSRAPRMDVAIEFWAEAFGW
ncbi:MAG: hypothetical protein M1818_000258 [Claussenomyces sp. TS43310]|nr:MAG: hypothetical protein M1818_000258 [Claussenomyces sp. TS43310]